MEIITVALFVAAVGMAVRQKKEDNLADLMHEYTR